MGNQLSHVEGSSISRLLLAEGSPNFTCSYDLIVFYGYPRIIGRAL